MKETCCNIQHDFKQDTVLKNWLKKQEKSNSLTTKWYGISGFSGVGMVGIKTKNLRKNILFSSWGGTSEDLRDILQNGNEKKKEFVMFFTSKN